MTGDAGEEKKSTARSGHYVGKLMVLIGAIVLVPILSLPFFPGDREYLSAFLIPGGLSVLAGGFTLTSRKTYGHLSDGMICAEDELGLGDDHTGIIVLPEVIDGRTPTLGADALDTLALLPN